MEGLHKYLTEIPHFIKLPTDEYDMPDSYAKCQEILINIEKISCIFSFGPESSRIFIDTGAGGNYGFYVSVRLEQKKVQKIIELAHKGYHYKQ